MSEEDVFAIYNRAIIDRLKPYYEYPPSEESVTLIPSCPCCGYGRTLFVHIYKQPSLIVTSDFTDWCKSCRQILATKATI